MVRTLAIKRHRRTGRMDARRGLTLPPGLCAIAPDVRPDRNQAADPSLRTQADQMMPRHG